MYVMNIDGNMIHHNTDAKCHKTKRIPHMCGTAFGHIGETRMKIPL